MDSISCNTEATFRVHTSGRSEIIQEMVIGTAAGALGAYLLNIVHPRIGAIFGFASSIPLLQVNVDAFLGDSTIERVIKIVLNAFIRIAFGFFCVTQLLSLTISLQNAALLYAVEWATIVAITVLMKQLKIN